MEGDRVAEEAARVPGLLHHQELGVQVESRGNAAASGHHQGQRAKHLAWDAGGEAETGAHGCKRERRPGRERVRAWSCERGPVHLLPAPLETLGRAAPWSPAALSSSRPPDRAGFTSAQGLRSQVPLGGPRIYSSACPASGHRPPAPGTVPLACPGRAPRAAQMPWIPAGRRIWAGRPVHRKEDRREGYPPARAPPPKAQLRTSPPCSPSRGFALLPGKEKRSRFGHRLLKGQHRPSLILSITAPPSPPNTCREPPKAWISPPRPLLPEQRRLSSKTDWTHGARGGICPAGLLRLLLMLERSFQAWPPPPAELERPGVGTSGNRPPRASDLKAHLAPTTL